MYFNTVIAAGLATPVLCSLSQEYLSSGASAPMDLRIKFKILKSSGGSFLMYFPQELPLCCGLL